MYLKDLKISFELVCRQCIFLILNIYAVRKMFGGQFYMNGELPTEVANTNLGEADGFTLAWTFMGHSYFFVLFIGVMQLVGAWFLLWNKTKILGVMILLPIMANIIMIDFLFLRVYSALAISIIIFSMLLMIVTFNKEKIMRAYVELIDFPSNSAISLRERIINIGITALTLVLVFSFCYLIERLTWVA